MEISRRTIVRALVVVFIVKLVVMGVGAYYSAQQVPPDSAGSGRPRR